MKTRHLRISAPFLTIRMLVALWAASLLFAWILLIAGWLVASRQLKVFAGRVDTDVKALDAARELELAILAHRREDLLWEATGQDYHRERSGKHLVQAERVAGSLDPYVTTPEEGRLLDEVLDRFKVLREPPPTVGSVETEARSVYHLLEAVEGFQVQNSEQMEASILAADRLRETMDLWAVGLLVGTSGLLTVGSLTISRRVVRPTYALTRAADAFGGGDLSVRAPVFHNDEMGALAQTFNNMASDIADREKDRLRFVAMVAHDLKNPVFAIEMAVRLLRGAAGNEQERDAYFDALTGEAKRLRAIVRDLSDEAQVASGHFQVRKAMVDLCALVRQLVQAQSAAFSDHQIGLDLPDACAVLGDADRIERVLMNLVSNAVKYSPAGTRVTVRVERRDSYALLSVSDQGPGISQEDARLIFQPFGRGRSADTLAEGTGLGLYVVKQIVEAHDGRIDVRSEPGQGATFQVRLPLA